MLLKKMYRFVVRMRINSSMDAGFVAKISSVMRDHAFFIKGTKITNNNFLFDL